MIRDRIDFDNKVDNKAAGTETKNKNMKTSWSSKRDKNNINDIDFMTEMVWSQLIVDFILPK